MWHETVEGKVDRIIQQAWHIWLAMEETWAVGICMNNHGADLGGTHMTDSGGVWRFPLPLPPF